MNLVVVTATTNPERAAPCLESWRVPPEAMIIVVNAPGLKTNTVVPKDGSAAAYLFRESYVGTVPAFRAGVDYALDHTDADVIACLHDDVEIHDPDWIAKTIRLFERHPKCGLAGFSGAIGLGDADIYAKDYSPMQLARVGFRSNLVDAEVHGIRSLLSEQVACNDGLSLLGRLQFFE